MEIIEVQPRGKKRILGSTRIRFFPLAKYPPVNAEKYLTQRLNNTYQYR